MIFCILEGLRLLTHIGFFQQNGLIRSEVFLYMERSKNLEKEYYDRAKIFTFLRVFDRKDTVFEISRNLVRNAYFQMTLNARKSCANSFLKVSFYR